MSQDDHNIVELFDASRNLHLYQERKFLAAFKEAAQWLGPAWWRVDPTVRHKLPAIREPAEAVSKWQLCPRMGFIRDNITVLSSGEAAMLAAMASFYCSEDAQVLWELTGIRGLADISARLEMPQRECLADMLRYYPGW